MIHLSLWYCKTFETSLHATWNTISAQVAAAADSSRKLRCCWFTFCEWLWNRRLNIDRSPKNKKLLSALFLPLVPNIQCWEETDEESDWQVTNELMAVFNQDLFQGYKWAWLEIQLQVAATLATPKYNFYVFCMYIIQFNFCGMSSLITINHWRCKPMLVNWGSFVKCFLPKKVTS